MVERVEHQALKDIFNGKAVGCGSECFQDHTGMLFLGKLPSEAFLELLTLYSTANRDALQRLKHYVGISYQKGLDSLVEESHANET